MGDHTLKEVEQLEIKLKQHEEIIIQLLEIIAMTNRRVADLTSIPIDGEISRLNDNIH